MAKASTSTPGRRNPSTSLNVLFQRCVTSVVIRVFRCLLRECDDLISELRGDRLVEL